jgi:aminomethyltransferase
MSGVRPVSASIIRYPGIPALPEGVERYRCKGGGSLVVRVEAGDHVTLIDSEGGQACELSFLDENGRFQSTGLGAAFTGSAEGLKAILSSGDEGADRTRTALERRGADLATAGAIRMFSEASIPGSKAEFAITMKGLLIAAAPATTMSPDAQDTATPIEIRIRRSRLIRDYAAALPEPMADPIEDIRIKAATASAYFVRAGEFIQIIDVYGRQCTDFQAFAARKVDKGLDLALDSTVTRTLLGRSYPAPGLPSKAFDRDFEPLVEVVQDTVGRHDAFATACNSRYYDDMGYPGHVNCTDNFNAALAPYGIAGRKGWEALNYFYNTNIDHNNQL